MQNNWIIISIVSAIFGGIIAFLLTQSWSLSLISFILILISVLLSNPQKRYMRVFWVILFMMLTFNKLFFEFIGRVININFVIRSNELGVPVTLLLIILAGLALILDLLERNGRLAGTFLEVSKVKIGNVSGDENSVNVKINTRNKS